MIKEDLRSYMNQKTAEKRILLSCQLDLTYNCNLDCIHCYVSKENRQEMKKSDIMDILDQLADLGTLYLGLSGGEIFTREDFFEIAEYARELHFALNISTNGTLINNEIADKLSRLNPNRISFSVYSMDPKIHDKITGVPGSLEKTIKAAKMLKNRNMYLRVTNIIMKQNINEYFNIYKFAEKLDAEFQVDPHITPKTDGNMKPLDYQINDNDLCRILVDPLLNENLSEEEVGNHFNSIYNDLPCSAAHNFCYISPYADVFPCSQFPLFCGNLKEESLNEIWYHSSGMLEASNLRMSNLPACSKCEIVDYCRYCPGLSILEENDLMEPSSRCCKEAKLLSCLKR
ncbi:MAG: radical SAM protein [Methanobacterium sp.]|nr:radical SAM protein [Methanobacterium sp.]